RLKPLQQHLLRRARVAPLRHEWLRLPDGLRGRERVSGESLTMQKSSLDRPDEYRFGTHLAKVVSVEDDTGRGRVQVRLYDHDDVGEQNAPIWARVAVPFAGSNMGAFFIPNKDDEVLITFINGDTRLPIVVGGLWNGDAQAPEELGGDGQSVDRWTITGK